MLYLVLGLLLICSITGMALFHHYPPLGAKPSGERLLRVQHSPHHNGEIFDNLNPVKKDYGWSFMQKMVQKQLNASSSRRPQKQLPFVKWSKKDVLTLDDSATTAIWFGHSAFFLKMNGKNILLDPMLGAHASPVPFGTSKRFSATLPLAVENLPSIDVVVLSHDHYDHLDYGSILALKAKTRLFLVPLGVGAHLEKWGVPPSKIKEFDWYETLSIDEVTFICTPAQHFSGRNINDKFRTLWCSWVINGRHKLFFSGDSGYFDGFKAIGAQFGPFDACLIECGQYDELWSDIHMFPEQTAQAYIDLKGNALISIHWGGFSLATHDWNDPIIQLSGICKKRNIKLSTPKIGERIMIGEQQTFSKWW